MLPCTLSVHSDCCFRVFAIFLCYVVLYSECLQKLLQGWFVLVFCHTHCGMLVLLSILVIVVLCTVTLCSKCLKQVLLSWFIITFCHTHCGILVLLSIIILMVLRTVTLCSKCLRQVLLSWFIVTFCHTNCGILVLLSILVIMVLVHCYIVLQVFKVMVVKVICHYTLPTTVV